MEVVLSPGNLGGEGTDGGPFRNEDVREWSRVDRITGMLERARVETGRWRANTRDAAQSYGKMIDSRERNSADGSLVQKARRQVEIFQSQGTSGRSFQVVRASQWSSSRATDSAFDVPITNPTSNNSIDETMNGEGLTQTPRLSVWRTSLEDGASDLDRLSCLCRKLHNEAMSNLWPLRSSARSPSPPSSFEESSHFEEIDTGNERLSTSSFGDRKSNSTEDLSSPLDLHRSFARECKTRRSLQIPNTEKSDEEQRMRRRNEFIAERARRFEECMAKANQGVKKSFISTKSFTPITDNDFVKNDPKHPSKLLDNGHKVTPLSRKANNKTVVHLRNIASPTQETEVEPRCINVTAIKLENDDPIAKENGLYGTVFDPSSSETTKRDEPPMNGTKPVKKVEFCKTEIHFAADSGKVNIVETDGKPPPTNKFRRRRRNNSLGAPANNNTQKNNMPLVHFGDTSYEKYIFGGQGKPPHEVTNGVKPLSKTPVTEDTGKVFAPIESENERWDPPQEIIRDDSAVAPTTSNEMCVLKDSYADTNLEKMLDNNKSKGTHTTTVNFLKDESSSLSKITEDKPSSPFSSSNHIVHKDIGPILDRIPNKNQIVSKDSENNQVLLKIVTTHKPLLTKVENDSSLSLQKSRLKFQGADDVQGEGADKHVFEESNKSNLQNVLSTDFETKDLCDNSVGDSEMVSSCIEAPMYENIFDAVSNDVPVYENFQIKSSPVTQEKKVTNDKSAAKKKLINLSFEKISGNSNDKRYGKVGSKVNNEVTEKSNRIKSDKAKRTVTPTSVSSNAKSDKNSLRSMESSDLKSNNKISSRLSNLRDKSVKRYKDAKITKDNHTKGTQIKKNNLNIDPTIQEHKNKVSSVSPEKNIGTVRSKKPVEVVYQTAVYNMKNEKLSTPTKAKEIKGPRLINDLICGSKLRRPSDNKKTVKAAIVSQNTSKRKETPTMNR